MEHRLAFLATDHRQLREGLLAYAEGRGEAAGLHVGQVKPHRDTLAILDGDEEMRRAVASLPARGKHDSLLQLWVRGLVVDWRGLYPAHARLRRLVLPGYPFAEQRYWVQGSPTPGPDAPMAAPVPDAAPAAVEPLPALTPAPAASVPAAAPIKNLDKK